MPHKGRYSSHIYAGRTSRSITDRNGGRGHWGNQTRSGQNASYNKTYPYYSGKLPGDGSHTVTDVLDCVKCYAGWHTCHICEGLL